MIPIRFFGTMRKEDIALNKYIVTNMKAIMYNPARIRKVCEYSAKHFKEKIEPNATKVKL